MYDRLSDKEKEYLKKFYVAGGTYGECERLYHLDCSAELELHINIEYREYNSIENHPLTVSGILKLVSLHKCSTEDLKLKGRYADWFTGVTPERLKV